MKTATQPRRARKATVTATATANANATTTTTTTTTATATATNNQYTTLISDFNSDSETDSVYFISDLSNTNSEISPVNHQAYQVSVLEEIRVLKGQLGYPYKKKTTRTTATTTKIL